MAWYWSLVVPLLAQAGHWAVAVDLPAEDPAAGLRTYADVVVRAIGERRAVILVAQSLGGFTAPLVCARADVHMLVFVNAMIPMPGETAGAWWENTGAPAARRAAAQAGGYSAEFDVNTYFLHDVPQTVLRTSPPQREQSNALFEERCGFERWPQIPLRVIASANDRFFPLEFQQHVARDRLQSDVRVIAGGHLVALSNPADLAEQLHRLATESIASETPITRR